MAVSLGFGLYYHMLDEQHFRFARQCGATHLVVHLTDYFNQAQAGQADNQPVGDEDGWGLAGTNRFVWEREWLQELVHRAQQYDLTIAAIENFDPIDWYDILLGGPQCEQQLQRVAQIVRNVGQAGIPCFGYNFSLAGVAGRCMRSGRGGAQTVGMDGASELPLMRGMVWNMVYDPQLYAKRIPEPSVTVKQLWDRFDRFIRRIVPVAAEAGVRMALHPDDPPLPTVRRQPRLVYQADLYHRALDSLDHHCNAIELCLGTLQEMPHTDVYSHLERFLQRDRVAYIHFRNVTGKVPHYRETFVDEGDLDMHRVMEILQQYRFDGVIVPDHTPQMHCSAPWHAGMAYAMGYMQALTPPR